MQFRWIAVIALYTFLIGPVFDRPGLSANTSRQTQTTARAKVRAPMMVRP